MIRIGRSARAAEWVGKRAALLVLALSLVLAAGVAQAASAPVDTVSPGGVDRMTLVRGTAPTFSWGSVTGAESYLEGSLDLGDLGFDWRTQLSIEGTERLVFRWKTSEQGAVFGRYSVTDGDGNVLEVGNLLPAPPPGEHRLFFIQFADLLPHSEYRVRIRALDGAEAQLGAPSAPVIVQRVCPGPVTQFIDRGLDLPIARQLEAIRQSRNVAALGGAIVTNAGIGVLGAVGIRKDGDPTAVTDDDRWHLGSDTKAMTATLVGILVDRGDTSWTRTIGEVFPAWVSTMDAEFRDVSFEQLAAHRSGLLQTSEDENSAFWSGGSLPQQRKEHTRRIVHRSSLGIPGVTFKYHNSNFIIAGSMLEEITGKSWESLMQDELFNPLGMSSAGFLAPGVGTLVDEPWGHSDSTGSRVPSRGDNAAALGPAGTVHASMRDWAKFIRLHLTGSQGGVTLSAATLARLHTEHSSNPLWSQRYGWGWINFDEFGAPALAHDGSNGLWYCSVVLYPSQGFALMAVTNIGSDVNGNGGAAVGDVISLLKNRHLEEIPDPIPSPCDDPQIQLSNRPELRAQSGLSQREKRALRQYNRAVRTKSNLRECGLALVETKKKLAECLARRKRPDKY